MEDVLEAALEKSPIVRAPKAVTEDAPAAEQASSGR
jgi:hypothetical protein